jgi:translation initiation factor IF-3
METSENIVLKLNELLEINHLILDEFDDLMKLFKEKHKPIIKILDFEYYNEARRESSRNSKIKNIELQKFDLAAENRELEKECINYISLKNEYKIEKSIFYYDQNFLFYFHLGTAKNDKLIREYLKEFYSG